MYKRVKISIVIPIYNTENYLKDCLDSVIHQTIDEIEIICINDSSTDNSLDILNEYAKKDHRIRILSHNSNKGLLAARKSGTELANGEYLFFLDSDDTIDTGLCEEVYGLMNKKSTDILQYTARQMIIQNESDRWRDKMLRPSCAFLLKPDIMSHFYIERKDMTSVVGKVYKTRLCKKAFSYIPDIWCYAGEDILIYFFLVAFASTYIGVKTKNGYNYNYGTGLSSNDSISLQKFSNYCKMSRFPEIIYNFLNRIKAEKSAYTAAEQLTLRVLQDCCKYYTCVSDTDRDKARKLLIQSWGDHPLFSELIIMNMERVNRQLKNNILELRDNYDIETERKNNELIEIKERNKELEQQLAAQRNYTDLVYASNSYRIGNLIVSPLSWIKKL